MWTEFIKKLMLEFCLYGFAVYRLVVIPRVNPLENKEILHDAVARDQAAAATGNERSFKRRRKHRRTTGKPRKFPEVANGQQIVLRWNTDTREWLPYDDTGASFKRKDGWRMLMPTPPHRWGVNNIPIYNSYSANALELSQTYQSARHNFRKRDITNSDIHVFAQMVKNLTSAGSGMNSQPWFQPAVHSAMASTPGDLHQPIGTRIADRLEAVLGLAASTDKYRQLQDKQSAVDPSTGKIKDPASLKPAKKHKEHTITDGFDAKEVTYRRAPEHLVQVLDMTFNLILYEFSVMPQVMGKNVNSERNAASTRIAEVSIDRYNEHIRQLRRFVQMGVSEVSSEAVADKHTLVKIEPCVTMHTLRSIESILTTEAARKLYACVYDVPIEYIDSARLHKKQEVMLEEGMSAGTRNKPDMTEDQKAASMKAKNEPK